MAGVFGNDERKAPVWTVIVAVLVAVVWSLAGFGQLVKDFAATAREPDGDISVFFGIGGFSLVISLVVWGVAFLIFWRRSVMTAPIFLAIIYGVVWIGNFAGFEAVKASAHRQDAGVVAADHQIAEVVTAFETRTDADQRAYVAELARLGFPEVIKPAFAENDPHRRKALARLAEMRALVAKNKTLSDARLDGLKAQVRALPVDANAKASFLAGFQKAEGPAHAQQAQIWGYEDQILAEYEAAMRVLARTEGSWVIREGKFFFIDPGALAAWRAPIARAEALAARQRSLIEAGMAGRRQMDANLKQMREVAAPP